MKELFFFLLGGFSGIFLMCCLQIIRKDEDNLYKNGSLRKEKKNS